MTAALDMVTMASASLRTVTQIGQPSFYAWWERDNVFLCNPLGTSRGITKAEREGHLNWVLCQGRHDCHSGSALVMEEMLAA